jgi:hypothetical protein
MKKLILLGLFVLMISLASAYDNYCEETDQRLDYHNKGECFSNLGYPGEDNCTPDGLLHELYCMDANACWFYDVPCEYGCEDGKCIPGGSSPNLPPEDPDNPGTINNFCEDTDKGYNLTEGGACSDRTGVYYDKCKNGKIIEYYCEDTTCKGNETECSNKLTCDEKTPASCISLDSDIKCIDHDKGKNYSVRSYAEGEFQLLANFGNVYGKNKDKCGVTTDNTIEKSLFYDCCQDSDSSKKLIESYCSSNGNLKFETKTCPNGCDDGVCLNADGSSPQPSVCPDGKEVKTDLANNGQGCCLPSECLALDICVDSGFISQLTDHHCIDGQWFTPSGTCIDTDQDGDYPDGENLYQKGKAIDFDNPENNLNDCCSNTLGGAECMDESDYLLEASCIDNAPFYTAHECECFNGACLLPELPDDPIVIVDLDYPCVDSDEGKNYYAKGDVSYLNAETDYEVKTDYDECVPGMPLFNLREYYCEEGIDGLYPNSTLYQCPAGCENGFCKTPPEIPDNFDDVEISQEQRRTGGCCINPLNHLAACQYNDAQICCPENEELYLSENEDLYTDHPGPKSFAECVWEYHYPYPDFSACLRLPDKKADLCKMNGCCCVRNDQGQFLMPAPSKKIACWGDGKFFVETSHCDSGLCGENYESGNYEIINEGTIPPRSEDSTPFVEEVPENRAFGCCCEIKMEKKVIFDNEVEEISWAGGETTQRNLCVGEDLYWITDYYHDCTPSKCIASYQSKAYEKVNPLVEIGETGCGEGGECDYDLTCKQDYLMENQRCCADKQCATPHDCVDSDQHVNLNDKMITCKDGKWHSLTATESAQYFYNQNKECSGACRTTGFLWWRIWGDSAYDKKNKCNAGEKYLGPCTTNNFWSSGKKSCCTVSYDIE